MALRTIEQNVELSNLLHEFFGKLHTIDTRRIDVLDVGVTILAHVIKTSPPAMQERLRDMIVARLDYALKGTDDAQEPLQ